MADIILICPECGKPMTISEYAKPDNLACPSCNKPMAMPEPAKASPAGRMLPENYIRAREEAAATAAKTFDPDKPEIRLAEITSTIHSGHKKSRVRMETFMPVLKATILFFILSAVLVYIRFFKGYTLFLEAGDLDLLRMGGAIAILFFHVTIVIEAFTQEFLTGLLCAVIPGYSIYYLFSESESFWLRAIVLALLVAFGKDLAVYIQEYSLQAYNFINAWLEAGGEFNKPSVR